MMARRTPWSAIALVFFLFSSSVFAISAVIGVDLGTEYIKASLVKPGIPLDIVLTKDSRRKELSAVAFKPVKNVQKGTFPERLYGSDAMALSARFPADVYPNLKALLGLPSDNSVVKEFSSRHPALSIEKEKTRGTTAFRSKMFAEDEEPWTVEEILAMEFQSIQKNAEALAGKGNIIKDMVITFPPFYTAEEKRAIELAADLAGLRILSLISDGLAVGLNYASSRNFPSVTEGGKAEHHLVFDMGAGSTKATLMRFQGRTVKDVGRKNKTIQEVQVLGTGWDRTLGGDALNAVIVDDMVANFIESAGAKSLSTTSEAVKAHGRAAAKLWKEAERLRQVLSANTNAQGSFEGLYEDIDFKYKISRADYEQMAQSFAERIVGPIKKALDAADLTTEDLDSIIIHGGMVRTPFVQKQLEKIAGSSDKIRSNVNSDESAVFGAGLKGAILSPSFRVKDIRTYDVANYAVGYKWTNIDEKPKHQKLFLPTSSLDSEKQISFRNQKDFTIKFYQHVPTSENVSKGSAEKDIMLVSTNNLTSSVDILMTKFGCNHAEIDTKFGVRLNPLTGEPEITKATVSCEVDDDKKGSMVDGVKNMFGFGSKKDAQEPLNENEDPDLTETNSPTSKSATGTTTSTSSSGTPSAKDSNSKPGKRLEIINIDLTVEKKGVPTLPTSEIRRMKDRLEAFSDSDRSRLLREDALNQLEGFTYRVRDLLSDDSFIAASTDAERAELDAKSKAASEWLYEGGADASRDELKTRLKEMKDIVTPIEFRKSEAATRPEQISALQSALAQTKSFIDTVKGQIEIAQLASSSSASAASESSSTTQEPSASATNEFDGLDDDEATSTTSTETSKSKPTPAPPMYTMEDLTEITKLYDSATEWLTTKLAEQEALPPTADPILLGKDLGLKATELTDAGMKLLMKSMKTPPAKPKSSSTKTKSKAKTAKASKSKTAKGSKQTADFGKDGKIDFEVFDGDDMPSEEQILEAVRNKKNAAAGEGEEKHDEL